VISQQKLAQKNAGKRLAGGERRMLADYCTALRGDPSASLSKLRQDAASGRTLEIATCMAC
jgi:hypothetical protein